MSREWYRAKAERIWHLSAPEFSGNPRLAMCQVGSQHVRNPDPRPTVVLTVRCEEPSGPPGKDQCIQCKIVLDWERERAVETRMKDILG